MNTSQVYRIQIKYRLLIQRRKMYCYLFLYKHQALIEEVCALTKFLWTAAHVSEFGRIKHLLCCSVPPVNKYEAAQGIIIFVKS